MRHPPAAHPEKMPGTLKNGLRRLACDRKRLSCTLVLLPRPALQLGTTPRWQVPGGGAGGWLGCGGQGWAGERQAAAGIRGLRFGGGRLCVPVASFRARNLPRLGLSAPAAAAWAVLQALTAPGGPRLAAAAATAEGGPGCEPATQSGSSRPSAPVQGTSVSVVHVPVDVWRELQHKPPQHGPSDSDLESRKAR